jgi:CheY-like chemotaxis protein
MADSGDVRPDGRLPTRELTGVHVLLVDDDPDIREALRRLLTLYGAVVTGAASVPSALHLLRHIWPTVLVTDLNMPDGDGYSLLSRVRALEIGYGRSVAAMLLTGMPLAGHVERSRRAGFAQVMRKPVDPYLFCETILELSRGNGRTA